MSRRLLVLGWHNIEPTWAFAGTSPEAGRRGFEQQVRLLRRFATVVPLRSALADLAEGRPLPRRAVALTFDDGYLDNVTVAAPVLHAAGLPATFFLVPGFLSGTRRVWWEELGLAFVHATAPELDWEGQRYGTADPDARRAAVEELGLPGFRADQLARHYFARLENDPDRMTDLPAPVRGRLAEALFPPLLTEVRHLHLRRQAVANYHADKAVLS